MSLSLFFTLTSNPSRAFYFFSPESYQPFLLVTLSESWQHARGVHSLLSQIPSDASVAASTYIVPHLSGRREIVRFPDLQLRNDAGQEIEVEWAIADFWQKEKYLGIFGKYTGMREWAELADRLLEEKRYGVIDYQEKALLLQKGAKSNPDALQAWQLYRQQIAKL